MAQALSDEASHDAREGIPGAGAQAYQAGTTNRRRSLRRSMAALGRHAVLIVVTIFFVMPFVWLALASLKSSAEIFAVPLKWLPDPVRWENYVAVLNYPGFPFWRFLWNSIFYAGLVTIGTVISCAAVAYGFARLPFPGRTLLFNLTIATLMIPAIVTFIPTFLIFKSIGLIGTYAPLIAPKFLGDAFFIFMLRQFFLGLPAELTDAARVDGAGEWRIFWQVMLPLMRPALLVVAVFTFMWTWHEFFGPLIYLTDPMLYPLSLGLATFRGQRTTEWALMMAGSMLTTLPLVLVFFLSQRYFLEGIKMTGLKG